MSEVTKSEAIKSEEIDVRSLENLPEVTLKAEQLETIGQQLANFLTHPTVRAPFEEESLDPLFLVCLGGFHYGFSHNGMTFLWELQEQMNLSSFLPLIYREIKKPVATTMPPEVLKSDQEVSARLEDLLTAASYLGSIAYVASHQTNLYSYSERGFKVNPQLLAYETGAVARYRFLASETHFLPILDTLLWGFVGKISRSKRR